MLMHAFLFKILFISGRLNRHREFFGRIFRYVKCERNTRLFSLMKRNFLNQSNAISGENSVLVLRLGKLGNGSFRWQSFRSSVG